MAVGLRQCWKLKKLHRMDKPNISNVCYTTENLFETRTVWENGKQNIHTAALTKETVSFPELLSDRISHSFDSWFLGAHRHDNTCYTDYYILTKYSTYSIFFSADDEAGIKGTFLWKFGSLRYGNKSRDITRHLINSITCYIIRYHTVLQPSLEVSIQRNHNEQE